MVYLLPAFFLTQCPNKNSPTSAGPGQIYKKGRSVNVIYFTYLVYQIMTICQYARLW